MSKKIFVIAGEASGDVLGGAAMSALREQEQDGVEFVGIGGANMEAQGLKSLLPMDELCVMGIFEIIWQLPRLLKLIRAVVEEIETAQPDIVLCIDLPDFNFRVAKMLKARGVCKAKVIHYVAPTVWAWRPGRAKKIAAFLDGIACLFPFEPKYFEKHGLKAAYVGHPIIEQDVQGAGIRESLNIPEETKLVGLYLGSRPREVDMHGAIFRDCVARLKEKHPSLALIVPTLPAVEFDVRNALSGLDMPVYIITEAAAKWRAMRSMDAAIAVSGTVGLELAYMNVAHIIGYRAKAMTYFLIKLLVKVRFAHLANILLERAAVPEFLQDDCEPARMASKIDALLIDEGGQAKDMRNEFDALRLVLRAGDKKPPSVRMAAFIKSFIG